MLPEFPNDDKKNYSEKLKKPNPNKAPHDSWEEYRKGIEEQRDRRRNVAWDAYYSTTFPEPPFEDQVRKIAAEAAEILIKKHQDYGPDNINNAPGGAINGLLVRMHDKMERLKTLILGKKEPKYESIEDTLVDMINYSIIALMVQRGKWPK